jgi:prepilin-type N-terminal cleavage/methylation domain-containing protein
MAHKKGFTLIELLLVVGIITILASIVMVAINPTKQMGDARDMERKSDIRHIIDAVFQFAIDHEGEFPAGITGERQEICVYDKECGGIDLSELRDILVDMPVDPLLTTTEGTNYFIMKDEEGRITVDAPGAEQTPSISVTQ